MEQFNETLDKNHQVFTALKKIIQRQQLNTKKQFGAVADIYMAKMQD